MNAALPAFIGFANAEPEKQFLADLLKFGDVRTFPIEKIYEYYNLNKRQTDTVAWLQSNLLPFYAERNKQDINLTKGSISFHRVGMIPGAELLIVSCMVFRLDAPKMKLLETRHIEIGRFGGRRLINPKYHRNSVVGEWVLKAEVSK